MTSPSIIVSSTLVSPKGPASGMKVFNHSLAMARIVIGNSKPKVSNCTGWVTVVNGYVDVYRLSLGRTRAVIIGHRGIVG